MMLKVGDTYEVPLTFTREQERIFTDLTGDINPIHLDADAAIRAGYPAPIVHGMLAAAMIGKVIGVDFPGKGTINMERSFQFIRPLYIDAEYLLKIKVLEIDSSSCCGMLKFSLKDINNKICLTGSTRVKNTNQFSAE